jgi:hypothetical protein
VAGFYEHVIERSGQNKAGNLLNSFATSSSEHGLFSVVLINYNAAHLNWDITFLFYTVIMYEANVTSEIFNT